MLVKRTGLLLAVLMAFSVWPAWAEAELTKDIMILYTSDVHCAIDQGWGYGGIYAVKQSLAEDNHVLLVDDGDAIQGGAHRPDDEGRGDRRHHKRHRV